MPASKFKNLGVGTLLLLSFSASADYSIVIYDDFETKNYCASSYSYSNNLESLIKENTLSQLINDVYSTEETKTFKTWKGEPVYRKVLELGDLSSYANTKNSWHEITLNTSDILELVNANVRLNGVHQQFSHFSTNSSQIRYGISKDAFKFTVTPAYASYFKEVTIVIEYTKHDINNIIESSNISSQIKNYLHFVLSGDNSDNVVSVVTNGKTFSISDGYYYDEISEQCRINP
jgi:hypothetical protein